MPLKGKRGSNISSHLKGGKSKQSITSHLHNHSSMNTSVRNAIDNSRRDESVSDADAQVPRTTEDRIFDMKCTTQRLRKKIVILESEQSTAKEKAKESDAKNKQILRAKNAQIKSLKKKVVVAVQEAAVKVSSANKKLDAYLARE